MFADWAAGLLDTTPDPVTSERHVASMVEVGSMFVACKLENGPFLTCFCLCVKMSPHVKPLMQNCVPLQVDFHSDQPRFYMKGFAG